MHRRKEPVSTSRPSRSFSHRRVAPNVDASRKRAARSSYLATAVAALLVVAVVWWYSSVAGPPGP